MTTKKGTKKTAEWSQSTSLSSRAIALVTAFSVAFTSVTAYANPQGGVVAAGQANIVYSGNQLNINQSSNNAIINWSSFNVSPNESVVFNQPSASSLTLNRVNDINPSTIEGQITANGTVVIANPNGVLFTPTSKIDVSGLIATSANIADKDFMAGNMNFSQPGNPNASVVNQGTITAADAGLVGFVAPSVENKGTINARLGKVTLASGDSFTLDMLGDQLISVAVSSDQLPKQLVANSGTIQADGGTVTMTAAAAGSVINSLVNNTGVIRANSVGTVNGRVILYAEGSNAVQGNVSANKGKKTGSSKVLNSGTITASGYGAGETGGKISLLADNVGVLNGSLLDASGDTGGGYIKIGGDFHGQGATSTALNTYVDANAQIFANALTSGNGGNIVVWSDNYTNFAGTIYANGGSQSGNGGYVETSGHQVLALSGMAYASAPKGSMGTWLLDPEDVTISTGADSDNTGNPNFVPGGTQVTSVINTNTITTALNAGTNVTITTGGDVQVGPNGGSITVNNAISATTGTGGVTGSLTLSSYKNIILNAGITLGSGSVTGGSLTLRTDNAGNNSGYINVASGLTISTNGGNIIMGGGNGVIQASVLTAAGVINTPAIGYATGNAGQAAGISLTSDTINAGSGTIVMNGKGFNTTTDSNYGISSNNAGSITTTSGNIYLTGVGGGGSGNSGSNIGINNVIASTATGTINLTATGGGAGSGISNYGIYGATISDTGTGIITMNATGGIGGSYGIDSVNASALSTGTITTSSIGGFYASGTSFSVVNGALSITDSASVSLNSGSNATSTGSGTISISGAGGGISTNSTGSNTIGGASATGAITITGDAISGASNLYIQTTGLLTIKPNSASTTVGVAGGAGSLNISSALLANTTIGSITIGASTDTGAFTVNAYTWAAPLTLNTSSGVITIAGAQTMGANNFSILTDVTPIFNSTVTTTGIVTLAENNGATSIGVAGGAGTINLSTGILNNITAGTIAIGNNLNTGGITVNARTWTSALSLGSNSGVITIAGAQSMGANNFTLLTNVTPTFSSTVSTTGTATLAPNVAATSIGVAGGAGTINLGTGILNNITAGVIAIGNISNTGGITVNAYTWTSGLSLISGGVITISGAQALGANNFVLQTITAPVLNSTVTTTGNALIEPSAVNYALGIAAANGNTQYTAAMLNQISAGSYTFGNAADTGVITLNPYAWTGPVTIVNGTGAIAITSIAGGNTFSNGLTINSSSAVTITGDSLSLGAGSSITTTGVVTFIPYTAAGTTVGVAGGAGTLSISNAILNNTNAGSIIIGGTTDTGAMTVNAQTWNSPVSLITSSGVITISGAQALGSKNFTLQSNVTPIFNSTVTTTGNVLFQPTTVSTSIGVAGGTGTFNIGTAILADITAGSITIGNIADTSNINVIPYAWTTPLTINNFSGLINITSTSGGNTYSNALTINAGSSDVNIIGDSLSLAVGASITTTGIINISPYTASTTIGIAGGVGSLNISNTILGYMTAGSFIFGTTVDTGAMTINAHTWTGPVSLLSGSGAITISGAQSLGSNNFILQSDATPIFNAAITTTGNVLIEPTSATTTIGVAGSAGTLQLSTALLNNITAGSITIGNIADTGAMTLNAFTWSNPLTLLSGSGAITISGAQSLGSNNFILQSDATPIFNAAITTTGNVLIEPTSATTTIGVAGGAGTLQLSTALLNNITAGTITIGAIGDAGTMTVNPYAWAQNLTLNSGTGAVNITSSSGGNTYSHILTLNGGSGNVTFTGDSLSLAAGSAITTTGNVTIVPFTASTTVGVAGGAGSLNISNTILGYITAGSITIGAATDTGAVTVNAHTWTNALSLVSSSGAITIAGAQAMGANNFTLQSDTTPTFSSTVTTTGNVTIAPTTASTTVGVAGGAGTLNISTAILADITAGSITIGNAAASGAMTVNAYTWTSALSLITGAGAVTISGAQAMGANNFTLLTNVTPTFTSTVTTTGNVTIAPSTASTTVGVAGGAGTLNIGTAILNNITAGSITIGNVADSAAMTVAARTWTTPLSLISGTGVITISGAQALGANNFTLQSDATPTFSSTVTTTGNVLLEPTTASVTTVGIAGGAGTLQLSTALLNNITAGSITIGNIADAGTITIGGAYTWNSALTLIDSGIINISASSAQTISGGKSFTLATNSTPTFSSTVTTTGNVILQPAASTTAILVAAITGNNAIILTPTLLGNIAAGSITIGATNDTGTMTVSAYTWTAPLTLISGTGLITISGAQAMGANNFTLQSDVTPTISSTVTTSGNVLFKPSTASTTVGVAGGIGTLNISTAILGNITAGSITIGNAGDTGAMNVVSNTWNNPLTLTNGTGAINITSNTFNAALTINGGSGNDTIIGDTLTMAAGTTITTTGSLTISPYTASTTVGVGGGAGSLNISNTILGYITANSLIIGNTADTGAMTVNAHTWTKPLSLVSGSGAITISGTQTMGANNFTLQSDTTPTLSASAVSSTSGNITFAPASASTTIGVAGGAGTLNISTALLGNISTSTGAIIIGNSADTAAMNVNSYAWANNLTLTNGTGAITITSTSGGNTFTHALTINAGSGTITFIGDSLSVVAGTTLTTTGNLTIAPYTASTTVGVAGGAGSLNISSTILGYITAGSFTIGATTDTATMTVSSNTWNNPLTLNNGTGAISITSNTFNAALTLNGGSGNVTFTGDSLSLAAGSAITTTGNVTIAPFTASTTVGVAGGAGSLNISNTILGYITAGSITIGAATDTGAVTVNAHTWTNALSLVSSSGAITIAGAQAMGANNFTLQSDTTPTFSSTVTTTGNVTIAPTTASTTVGVAGGAGTLNISTAILADITAGSITIGNAAASGAMTVNAYTWTSALSLITGAGAVTISGAQAMGANNFTLLTNVTPTFTSTVTTTGNVTIAPSTASTTVGVAGGAGTLNIGTAILNNITAGSITIGNVADSAAMTVAARTWTTPLSLISGTGVITISGAQALGANNFTLQSDATPTFSSTVTTTGNALLKPATASTTVGVAGGAGTLNFSTSILNNITAGSYTVGNALDSGAMAVSAYAWANAVNLTGGSGAITITGDTINIPAGSTITSTSSVSIVPLTLSTNIGFSGGAGGLAITQAIMNDITSPIVNIGTTADTGTLTTGAYTSNSQITNSLNLFDKTITVGGNFSWSNNALVLFSAANSITINAGSTISNTYAGSTFNTTVPVLLALRADSGSTNGAYGVVNNGTINFGTSTGAVSIFYDTGGTYTAGTQTTNGSWVAPTNNTVNTQFTAYKLINTVADLTGMTLTGTYALGKTINGGGGVFNSNAGIGALAAAGILDGQYGSLAGGSNYGVTGYTLTTAANTANSGLFTTNAGKIRNLQIGLTVSASNNTNGGIFNTGSLVGTNTGVIANVTTTSSDTVTVTNNSTGANSNTNYIGGLVGQNSSGTIIGSSSAEATNFTWNSASTGTSVTGIGGLVGYNTNTITNASATGNVSETYSQTGNTTTYMGGLVGYNNTGGSITNGSTSTGTINAVADPAAAAANTVDAGGLVGYNVSTATITGSNSSENVTYTYSGTSTGASVANIGGLVGLNSSTAATSIGASSATGSVTEAYTASGNVTGSVGGLVGNNAGTITNSTASIGTVTAASDVTGVVVNNTYVGGLAGQNSSGVGIITGSSASGNVIYNALGSSTGASLAYAGGLVGYNAGTATTSIGTSNASGNITAQYSNGGSGSITIYGGGLIGQNGNNTSTSINATYAIGNVTSNLATTAASVGEYLGGLVGYLYSTSPNAIVNSYSKGGIVSYTGTGTSTAVALGGLLGYNGVATGLISGTAGTTGANTYTYSTDNVIMSGIATPTNAYIGGLIGYNPAPLAYVYSTGAVSYTGAATNAYVGGLVGYQSINAITHLGAQGNAAVSVTNNVSAAAISTVSEGGLFGDSTAVINNFTSSAPVTYTWQGTSTGISLAYVGGLVGQNANAVNNSSATGSVTETYASNYFGNVTASVGGLVGLNTTGGAISNSSTSIGTVTAASGSTGTTANSTYAGGLVGQNGTTATITGSSSSENVIYNALGTSTGANIAAIGGLVGYDPGTAAISISTSNASGTVTARYNNGGSGVLNGYVGGLIGQIGVAGSITVTSGNYATGSVTSSLIGGIEYIGGLVGYMYSAAATNAIVNSYSTTGTPTYTGAAVNGTTVALGGLLGFSQAGLITGTSGGPYTYSTEAVNYNGGNATPPTVYLGGLVGYAANSISYAYSTGNVSYSGAATSAYVGGLIGQIAIGSAISNIINQPGTVSLTNTVSGANISTIGGGGLIGYNLGAVNNFSTSAPVTYTYNGTSSGASIAYVGGLVGLNSGSVNNSTSTAYVSNSYGAIGNVSSSLGGLVGYNGGVINNSSSSSSTVASAADVTSTVVNTVYAGGLAGQNAGTGNINFSNSSDSVVLNVMGSSTGANTAGLGGLVGSNGSTVTISISNSNASGSVAAQYSNGGSSTVSTYAGGLVGYNGANTAVAISTNYATGNVTSSLVGTNQYLGGLVGYGYSTDASSIINSYSTAGTVTYTGSSATTAIALGGLVGYNVAGGITGTAGATNTYSWSNDSVTYNGSATPTNFEIGGLAGYNAAAVSYTKAYGVINFTDTTAIASVGGLIGYNTTGGAITNSLTTSAGSVTAATTVSAAGTDTIYVGGLVGQNLGTATIATSSSAENVVYNYSGSSSAISTAYVGGLVGWNTSTAAPSVTTSSASGTVTAQYSGASGNQYVTGYIGGLIGLNGATAANAATISNNFYNNTSGTSVNDYLTGTGTVQYVGGLVGYNNSTSTSSIVNSYVTGGTVTYSGASGSPTTIALGGLVGYNGGGTITGTNNTYQTYSSETVTYNNTAVSPTNLYVGGLAGYNAAAISYTEAYGAVNFTDTTVTASVGGLVGYQATGGAITNSLTLSTGYVTVATTVSAAGTNTIYAGGLVGQNAGTATIAGSSASEAVTYNYSGSSSAVSTAYVGGLVGYNISTAATSIGTSYANGAVVAQYSGASGNQNVSVDIGGLIGENGNNTATAISGSFAAGNVTSSLKGGNEYIGGLVGLNYSSSATAITNAYAAGTVTYTGAIGATATVLDMAGLIGYNQTGTITNTYATGYINNGATGTLANLTSKVGGFTGNNAGTIGTTNYWDTLTTGQGSAGSGTDTAQGLTTAQMQASNTTLPATYTTSSWSGAIWSVVAGSYPYLSALVSGTPQVVSGFAYSDHGATTIANTGVSGLVGGVALNSLNTGGGVTTGNNGYYYFLTAASTVDTTNGSQLLTYLTGATKGDAFTDTTKSANIANLNINGNYLTINSASSTFSAMTTDLSTALGASSGVNFPLTLASGALTMNSGVNLDLELTNASTSLDKAITLSGSGILYINDANTVTQTAAFTAPNLDLTGGGTYTLTNASNNFSTIAGNAGTFNLKDSVNVTTGSILGAAGLTATTGNATLVTTGSITLASSDGITTSHSGSTITLADGTTFTNNAGASALTTNAGNYQVWSTNPASDSRGGLTYNFKQYNATYGSTSVLGTGNGFLYTLAPTISATLTGTASKTYDTTTAATITGGGYSGLTGGVDSDTVTITSITSGTYNNKNVGTGKTVTGGTISATTGAATVYGYQTGTISGNIGTITAANLTVSGLTASNKVYDALTTDTLGGSASITALGSDVVSLSGTAAGNFANKNVANGKSVTVTGLSLAGADAGNYTLVEQAGLTANITPASLTVSGLTASNKVYDTLTTDTLVGTATITTALGGDVVSVSGTATGSFADKNVGTAKAVTLTGLSLTGADAGNYTLALQSGLTANITPASLTVSGLTASNKVYDTLTTDTLVGTATITTALGGDVVSVSGTATGSFADKNVGTAKAVTLTGLSLTGADAGNYTLALQSGLTANITPASLTASLVGTVSKVYDGTTTAKLDSSNYNLSGLLGGDVAFLNSSASGRYDTPNPGNQKAVFINGLNLAGVNAGNYNLTSTSLTGNIGMITGTLISLPIISLPNSVIASIDQRATSQIAVTFKPVFESFIPFESSQQSNIPTISTIWSQDWKKEKLAYADTELPDVWKLTPQSGGNTQKKMWWDGFWKNLEWWSCSGDTLPTNSSRQ